MRVSNRTGSAARYLESYESQVDYFGTRGHRRLRDGTVLIVGDGRVGHAISLTLASSGIGRLILVDPQRIGSSDLNRCAATKPVDVGRWKVDSTAGLLLGRPFLEVVPIIGRAEELSSLADAHGAECVVSACNTISARASVAAFAVDHRIPHVAAGVTDARRRVAGSVVTWMPATPELACPACFLDPRAVVRRGESLLAPVTSLIASLAAWNVVNVLSAGPRFRLDTNYVAVDFGNMTLDSFRTLRRRDCRACAKQGIPAVVRDQR